MLVLAYLGRQIPSEHTHELLAEVAQPDKSAEATVIVINVVLTNVFLLFLLNINSSYYAKYSTNAITDSYKNYGLIFALNWNNV